MPQQLQLAPEQISKANKAISEYRKRVSKQKSRQQYLEKNPFFIVPTEGDTLRYPSEKAYYETLKLRGELEDEDKPPTLSQTQAGVYRNVLNRMTDPTIQPTAIDSSLMYQYTNDPRWLREKDRMGEKSEKKRLRKGDFTIDELWGTPPEKLTSAQRKAIIKQLETKPIRDLPPTTVDRLRKLSYYELMQGLSPKDREAVEWALKNPDHELAPDILKKHGFE